MDSLTNLASIAELVSNTQSQLNRLEKKLDVVLLNQDKIKAYVKKIIKEEAMSSSKK
mgnify:CR=1 FL=1